MGKRKGKYPPFAPIPREFMLNPPVDQLSSTEMAMVAGVLTAARFSLARMHHQQAMEAGARTIEQEKQYARDFKRAWRRTKRRRREGLESATPLREHTFDPEGTYRPGNAGDTFLQAGKFGYREELEKLRHAPAPKSVTFEVSRSRLLKCSGMSADAKNLRLVGETLTQLCKPLRLGDERFPSLILSMRILKSSIALTVNGDWMQPPFGRVPLPFPTRSLPATALHLFLHTIKTNEFQKRASSLKSVCERIGIDTTQSGWRCAQALKRALNALNKNLRKYNRPRFKLEWTEDNCVKFIKVRPPAPEIHPLHGLVRRAALKRVKLLPKRLLDGRERFFRHMEEIEAEADRKEKERSIREWPREQFKKRDIDYEPAAKAKSDLYRDLLPALNSGQVVLLDHERLVNQLVALERRTARGGRDSIDHPPGGHDDVANAVAGVAAVLLDDANGYDESLYWVTGDAPEPKMRRNPWGCVPGLLVRS